MSKATLERIFTFVRANPENPVSLRRTSDHHLQKLEAPTAKRLAKVIQRWVDHSLLICMDI
jgi:hypothetical protein